MSENPSQGETPLLQLRAVTKSYPGVIANDRIDLSIKSGEIHALLGENGAGKSTLVRVIHGVTQPDSGEIAWTGKPVNITSPAAARRLGIGMVFQHFTLFETLTVAENISLGIDGRKKPAALVNQITEVADSYGLMLDPHQHVHELSVGERQRVEIVRCLLQEPRLIIMDEPTSVLTPQEVERLFTTLRRLRDEGRSILFISHKLEEIRDLCDRATVLRRGKVVAACEPREETAGSLARMMVGEDVSGISPRPARALGDPVLELSGLSMPPLRVHGIALTNINLTIRAGEIVGIAGVAGNGQSLLLSTVNGEKLASDPGAVRIAGKNAGRSSVIARRRLGLAFVPEERLGRGAVSEMDLADNALLTAARGRGLVSRGLMRSDKIRGFAEEVIQSFGVVCGGVTSEAHSLSGGNMQKFILGREIQQAPKLLVAAHPIWGVDVGSARKIQQALIDLSLAGTSILLVSEDLDELFELCDRLAVLSNGRLSPVLPIDKADRETIGTWMAGMFRQDVEAGTASAA